MESIGAHLRSEREARHISLEEVSRSTRISVPALKSLEADRFDELPARVFTRGFIRSYAKAVGFSADTVLEWFDRLHRAEEATPAPLAAVSGSEGGRRVGIAVALVILLVLFTLALSIVLRPRQRDIRRELSEVPVRVIDPGSA